MGEPAGIAPDITLAAWRTMAADANRAFFVIADPDHPEISATLWRTVSDHDRRRYYFESALQPAIYWVDLDRIDFSEGADVVGVATSRPEPLAGEISGELNPMDRVQWI